MTGNINNALAIGQQSAQNRDYTFEPRELLHLSSPDSARLLIEADVNNADENANAQILFSQDGGDTTGKIGFWDGTNSIYVWNSSAEDVVIGTDDKEQIRVSKSGNVGMGGVIFPDTKLHVDDPRPLPKTGSQYIAYFSNTFDGVNTGVAIGHAADGESLISAKLIGSDTQTGLTIDAAAIRLKTSNQDVGILTHTGRLGIGNTDPKYPVDITNTTRIGEYLLVDGNVGIGTSSPGAKLQVAGRAAVADDSAGQDTSLYGSFGVTRSATSGTKSYIAMTRTGSTVYALGISDDSSFVIGVPNDSSEIATERMRIDHSGNLLVGAQGILISNQGFKVFGASGRFVSSMASGKFSQISHVGGSGNETLIEFVRANKQIGTITSTTTSTSYNTSSDYRLKENVQPMQNALDKVAQLKPVTYKWKSDGSDGQGFIAHELAEVCPDAVSGEKDATTPIGVLKDANGKIINEGVKKPEELEDGQTWEYTEDRIDPQGIDPSKLVATLTAALQEAVEEIEHLKARVYALERT